MEIKKIKELLRLLSSNKKKERELKILMYDPMIFQLQVIIDSDYKLH